MWSLELEPTRLFDWEMTPVVPVPSLFHVTAPAPASPSGGGHQIIAELRIEDRAGRPDMIGSRGAHEAGGGGDGADDRAGVVPVGDRAAPAAPRGRKDEIIGAVAQLENPAVADGIAGRGTDQAVARADDPGRPGGGIDPRHRARVAVPIGRKHEIVAAKELGQAAIADLVAARAADQAVAGGNRTAPRGETGQPAAESDRADSAIPARRHHGETAAGQDLHRGADGVARMRTAQGAEQRPGAVAEKIDRARIGATEVVAGAGDERRVGRKIEESRKGPAEGVGRTRIGIDELESGTGAGRRRGRCTARAGA